MLLEDALMQETQPQYINALERYERPLIRYAYNHIQDLEEESDGVQDVFLNLSQHIITLDAE